MDVRPPQNSGPRNSGIDFPGGVEHYGTPVPDADIDVFVKKLGVDQQPIRLRTDSNGEFSANLPEGQYAVRILNDGGSLFWVNISPSAIDAKLLVKLCNIMTE